jgi:MFS family permease
VTIGAAAFQFPVGRLSDALDRRVVLLILVTATAALEIFIFLSGPALLGWPLIVTGGLMGGIIATQYYTVSAHTNDRTGRENAVGVAAALLFLYCAGAILGPLTAALAMQHLGPGALFLHNCGLHVAIAVFVALRMLRRPPPLKAA